MENKYRRDWEDRCDDYQVFADSEHHPTSIDQIFMKKGNFLQYMSESKHILYYSPSSEQEKGLVETQNAESSSSNGRD